MTEELKDEDRIRHMLEASLKALDQRVLTASPSLAFWGGKADVSWLEAVIVEPRE